MIKNMLFACLIFFVLPVSGQKQSPHVEYQVSMPEPHTHYFEVKMIISGYPKEIVNLEMPVWAPGSYKIREFPENIEGFYAKNKEGKILTSGKLNKNTWQIQSLHSDEIQVFYKVYAFEISVRTSFLDDSHGFILGSSVFMYVDSLKDQPSTLKVLPFKNWEKITTPLKPVNGEKHLFYAADYEELADSPIEIGNQLEVEFIAENIPHTIALYGEGNFDTTLLKNDLTAIVKKATAIFGENPNDRYIFFIHNTDNRGGGLEHLNSTVLQVNRWSYKPEKEYHNFLSLAAHEYFHLWLVKRLRPKSLISYDYNSENYSDLLWLMEGITSYYDTHLMLQCGFYNKDRFIYEIINTMNEVQNTPGAKVQSLAEAGFDAWIKFYRGNENSINSQISYYKKGMIIGALLDLEIIHSTKGKQNLDDLMVYLYDTYYKKENSGITTPEVQQALEKITGNDFTDFFNDYIYGTKDIDLAKFFDYAGINVVNTNDSTNAASLGIRYATSDGKIIVRNVLRGGSAWDGGINAGDELIAMEGYRITPDNLSVLLQQKKQGDVVTFLVNREGIIRELAVTLLKDTRVNFEPQYQRSINKQQQTVMDAWLER